MNGTVSFTYKTIILGSSDSIALSYIISIGKGMVAREENLNTELFVIRLRTEIQNERYVARNRGTVKTLEAIWGQLDMALRNRNRN